VSEETLSEQEQADRYKNAQLCYKHGAARGLEIAKTMCLSAVGDLTEGGDPAAVSALRDVAEALSSAKWEVVQDTQKIRDADALMLWREHCRTPITTGQPISNALQ